MFDGSGLAGKGRLGRKFMKRIGVIMHGITGRMGYNQHLVRSVLAIRDQGGVLLKNGERVMLDPILVGRNGAKIEEIAKKHNRY